MSVFFAFGGILLLLVVVVAVSAVRERAVEPTDSAEGDPAARRDAALAALRELEFDYRTDKIAEEEYRHLRAEYAREAVRARDEAGDETEEAEEACAACGASLRPGARFCARCGAPRGEAEGGTGGGPEG